MAAAYHYPQWHQNKPVVIKGIGSVCIYMYIYIYAYISFYIEIYLFYFFFFFFFH